MKLDTLTHPKTYDLTSMLGCKLPTTLGYLQLLWKFVGQHSVQGDIGKWNNGAISGACQWEGDADEYINSLVTAGFLDESKDHRLLIHDWQDHAPSWVRAKLKKLGLVFIVESKQEELLTEGTTEATVEGTREPSYRGEERSGVEKRRVERKGKRKFTPPTMKEVSQYFVDNDYPKELGEKAFKSYDVADWHDTQGKPVKNWKQKMINVWFKEENKRGNDNGSNKQAGRSGTTTKLQRAAAAIRRSEDETL